MSRLLLSVLAIAVALLQVSALAGLGSQATAVPLLPIALFAAWGATRGLDDLWVALPMGAVPLGLASDGRIGWFVIALLPTLALLMIFPAGSSFGRRIGMVTITSIAGASAFTVLMLLSQGTWPAMTESTAGAALMTAGLAVGTTCLLWPVRSRLLGLYE